MGDDYRAGILKATNHLTDAWIARVLPPEHRVAAKSADEWLGINGFLIEGPTLPLVPPGAVPQEVKIVLMESQRGDEIRVDARWEHAPDALWLVGTWPGYWAYRADSMGLQGDAP